MVAAADARQVASICDHRGENDIRAHTSKEKRSSLLKVILASACFIAHGASTARGLTRQLESPESYITGASGKYLKRPV